MNKALLKKNERIHAKYVPGMGPTGFLEIEVFRAANGVMHDWYNNGWTCNNYTDCLDFLHENGYFKNVCDENLAFGTGKIHEAYMDKEIERIIEVIVKIEKGGNFTVSEKDCRGEEYGISTKDWENLCFGDDEDDDEY